MRVRTSLTRTVAGACVQVNIAATGPRAQELVEQVLQAVTRELQPPVLGPPRRQAQAPA